MIIATREFEYEGVQYTAGQPVTDHLAGHRLVALGFAYEEPATTTKKAKEV